jgi:hypothetical protein
MFISSIHRFTRIFFVAVLATVFFVGCKKEKEEPTLEGKWTLGSILVKEYNNGALTSSDFELGSGQTFEFRSDGTLIYTEGGSVQTSTYTLNGDIVTFGGENYTLQDLEEHSVTLYHQEQGSMGASTEAFIYLTR